MQPARAPQLTHGLAVDDPKLQAELVAHLLLPLHLNGSGADDQDRSSPVAKEHLKRDQPRLNRLAKADVIGDEQIHARHLERTNDWIELVILDLDAATKW